MEKSYNVRKIHFSSAYTVRTTHDCILHSVSLRYFLNSLISLYKLKEKLKKDLQFLIGKTPLQRIMLVVFITLDWIFAGALLPPDIGFDEYKFYQEKIP